MPARPVVTAPFTTAAAAVDGMTKGLPPGSPALSIDEVETRGWNILAQDLPLPLAVLRASAIEHNSRWMQRFLALSGAVLAPHGKTYMSPELFRRQLADGAWAITVSTGQQVRVCRQFGFSRLLMANQLVCPQAIRYILDEIAADPDFDFYCLVDSMDGVALLAEQARQRDAGRPLQVLVEGGFPGGRTGCRDVASALAVARAVKAAEPYLALRGVEGFEGVLMLREPARRIEKVDALLSFLIEIARAAETEMLFAPGPIILTAGGSAFYDRVVAILSRSRLEREVLVVTRSGGYLTHDSEFYTHQFSDLLGRSAEARSLGTGLQAALEVWSYVQSRPEPELAILTMGKRDAGFDLGMPVPLKAFRPRRDAAPRTLDASFTIRTMNDQHAYLILPGDADLRVGDMVACGISHPCLTFDRWQVLFLVDDDYRVTSAIRTYF